jgi:hypothetical protein
MLSVSGFTVSDAEDKAGSSVVPSVLLRQPENPSTKAVDIMQVIIPAFFIVSSESFFTRLLKLYQKISFRGE